MQRFRAIILLVLFCGMACGLSGCLDDSLRAFFFKPDYTLSGLDNNTALKKEMQIFLGNRLADIKKPKVKAEQAEAAAYQADLVKTDLADQMKAKGYYDSNVVFHPGKKPWSGDYSINSGAVYKIASVTLRPSAEQKFYAQVAVLKGQVLDAAVVLTAEAELVKAVQKDSCAFTLEVTHEVTLDARAKTADIVFSINAGGKAAFGPAEFRNPGRTKLSYLEKTVPWKEGDCFRREKIDETRAALFQTGIFSRVDLVLPQQLPADGRVPVVFALKERAPRSISFGVSYYTDEGPGVTAGWKHRNFFGAGETVDAEAKVSSLIQSLNAKFTSPYFLRHDQSLSFTADLSHEDSDAYNETGLSTGVSIKRDFSKRLSGTTGLTLEYSKIDDKTLLTTDTFTLLSLPQSVKFDSRDNVLDATRGWLLEGSAEPFIDVTGTSPAFWKTVGSAKTYLALSKTYTLAGRVKAGSILGPSTASIPATKRFYAGGGGSVRGFGYQEVGPVAAGKPSGGRSLAEASGELRFRMTDTLGAVAFVDAGSVSETVVPDFSNLSIGAGAGLRYYTSFGPLRFDVGVPLNNRNKTSSSYQLYISIGQAF